MINVSAAWMQSLYNDHRNYLVHLKITLQDNTVLNLTNENIWGGSLSVDDAVSSDNEFQIGAAIINKMSVTINNIYGDYDPYDFYGARVELKIGLIIDGEEEKINKGKYIVNNATYNGQLIALECYDYMYFFDVSYNTSNQIFPATIDDIVRNCCTDVGVSLNTYDFPHKNYLITTTPEKEKTTYREIISWCAQICGCFARCNTNGQLEFKWYDFATLDQTAHSFLNGGIFDEDTPYSTGNTADGGRFNPWNLGDVYDGGAFNWNTTVHTITSLYSLNVSVDDVIITRIQAIVKAEDTQNQAESEKAYNIGTAGYTVEIRNNPFITESNVDEILSWLGTQIIGVKFRKASISHASDPSIEAGDSAVVIDRKNTIYPIIISRTTFSTGGSQNSISAAQNPLRNSAARFSAETKNYVDLRQRIQNERTTRQQIEAQLALDIANSNGMYKTETTEGGATKYYLHNKPQLSDSAIRILFSDVGITVTANGLDANPTWYGLRVNGDLISRILTATGVNADWIDTGALVVRDNKNNLVFKADISNHTVYVNGYATYTDLSGNGTTTINGANIKTGTISAARLQLNDYAKFTDLSGNGTTTINGANIKTGTISAARLELTDYAKFTDLSGNGTTTINGANIKTGTINADLIKAGTLQSQDSARYPNFSINLSDGTITIKHGSINLGNNNFIVDDDGNVTIKKGSITIGTNENFKVTSNGSVTMKNATITGYLTPDDVGTNGSTTISGDRIKTGTIDAKYLNLSGCLTAYDVGDNGKTKISGSRITTGTIDANLITAGTLKSQGYSPNFSLNLSTGELTMKSGSINIANKFIVDTYGNATLSSATITGSPSISGYATQNDLSAYPLKTNLSNGTTKIDGSCIQTGRIQAAFLDLSGVASIDSLKNGTTTINGGCITTGVIQDSISSPKFKIDFTNKKIEIKQGEINLGNGNFIVDNDGNVTMKKGSIIIGSNKNFEVTKDGLVTMKKATITGYLTETDVGDSGKTVISGNRISSGTIDAKYLNLSSVAKIESLKNGTTTINGGCITTGVIQDSITSPKFKIDFTNKKIEIKQGEINLGNGNFKVDNSGNVTIKSGSITIGTNENFKVKSDGSVIMKNATISGYAKGDLSQYATQQSLADGTTNVSGGCISTGIITDSLQSGTKFNLNTGELYLVKGKIILGSNEKFKVNETGYVTAKRCTIDSYENGYRVQITSNALQVSKDNSIISRFYSTQPTNDFQRVSVLESYYSSNSVLYINCGAFTDNPQNPKGITISNGGVKITGNLYVTGNFDNKGKLIQTKDYSERTLYCYETTTPYFGDIGEAVIGQDGYCYIMIDSVFSETINPDNYQVFIQKYGNGECYVYDRTSIYFIICGTPNLKFGWEIKCKQINTGDRRLENNEIAITNPANPISYNADFERHINQINKDREII